MAAHARPVSLSPRVCSDTGRTGQTGDIKLGRGSWGMNGRRPQSTRVLAARRKTQVAGRSVAVTLRESQPAVGAGGRLWPVDAF